MPGPMGSLLRTRLFGTALRFWLALLVAALLAALAAGIAIESGGAIGVAVLLIFGMSILLICWILLRIRG